MPVCNHVYIDYKLQLKCKRALINCAMCTILPSENDCCISLCNSAYLLNSEYSAGNLQTGHSVQSPFTMWQPYSGDMHTIVSCC